MRISLIVAADLNDVIGYEDKLPWSLPGDLKRFRTLTTGHVVIAGARTHRSIVERLGKPLPGRFTIVMARYVKPPKAGGVIYVMLAENALLIAKEIEEFSGSADKEVFVIGGRYVYERTLPFVERVYLTRVQAEVEGDTVMPPGWLKAFTLLSEEKPPQKPGDDYLYSFETYERG